MDVKTLCLGLLSVREACGYDLKKTFETSFKHFFPAGYGSIYPALADLAAKNLVECEEIPQQGKPDRKVYRITPAGEQAFVKALNTAEPRHKIRSEFLVMMYFADRVDDHRLIEVLDDHVEQLHETMRFIAQQEPHGGGKAGAAFVAGFGAVMAQAAADYIESNRHMLTPTASMESNEKSLANCKLGSQRVPNEYQSNNI